MNELCSAKRSQSIAYPRQVAMYLSRALTDSSLPKIGKEFGGRDHTTVMHANAKIEGMIREDRSVLAKMVAGKQAAPWMPIASGFWLRSRIDTVRSLDQQYRP